MICPHHGIVPDHHLACMACTSELSKKSLRVFQKEPLRRNLSRRDPYFAARTIKGACHIMQYGAEEMPHCNEALPPRGRKGELSLADLIKGAPPICADCRVVLLALIEEVKGDL